MMTIFFRLLLLLNLFFVFSCKPEEINPQYVYRIPEDINDGIVTDDINSVGLDTLKIAQMMDAVNDGEYGELHSLLILMDNKLVLEEYFGAYTVSDIHKTFSATKSVSSSLVGVAINQGIIDTIDEPIYQYFTDYNDVNWTDIKKRINLFHILTMTSSFDWDELSTSFTDTSNSHFKMLQADDWNKYVLEKNVISEPGYYFTYNTGAVNLLAPILSEISGQEFADFTDDFLFSKLGIEDYIWLTSPQDYALTGGSLGGLLLRPRDMLKFGMLYLNNGKWQNEQIIDQEYIQQSFNQTVPLSKDEYYGYLWWLKPLVLNNNEIIYAPQAIGYAGQFIILIREYNMAIIITGFNPETEMDTYQIVQDYIIPSII